MLGKSASLPSSPLSLMINSNILKKGALATGDKEERPDNNDDDDDTSRYGHNDHAEDYNYDCLCDEDYDKDDNDNNDDVRMMTTTIIIMKVMLINMVEGAKRICFCRSTIKFLKIDRNIEALFIVKCTILVTNREVDP